MQVHHLQLVEVVCCVRVVNFNGVIPLQASGSAVTLFVVHHSVQVPRRSSFFAGLGCLTSLLETKTFKLESAGSVSSLNVPSPCIRSAL